MTELEKQHALQEVLFECYHSAVRDMQQYAVEIDDQITPAHRQHLAAILMELTARTDIANLTDTRSVLRNELRDYRDRAAIVLNRLRLDLSAKAEALQTLVESMASADGDHEDRLQSALADLRELSAAPAAAPVRESIMEVSDQIEASIEELKKQNGLTVSQFMIEIKTLHNRIETLETAGRKDVLTGLTTRLEMEKLISSEVDRQMGFSLLLLRICNLPMIQRQFGAGVRADVISAFAKRLRAGLPPAAVAGRWSEDRFMVLLPVENVDAIGLARHLAQHVSGTYVCMEDGKPLRPDLMVNVSVIDHPAGGTHESLIARISQL